MKKMIIFFLLFLAGGTLLLAQQVPETGTIPISMSSGGGQFESMYANLVSRRNSNYHSMVGSPFLNEQWTKASVEYKDQMFTFDKVKVDVLNNCLEILLEGENKILDAMYFKNFTMQDPESGKTLYFVNGMNFKIDRKALTGFMKKTQVGEMNIYTLFKARIVSPGQNSKLMGVDPRDKIVHTQDLYIENEGKLFQIKNKKSLLEAMRKKQYKAKKYMDTNKVNVKEEDDLVKLLIYCQE